MPRRILQVVRSLRAETGGVATAVRHLSTSLRARGDEVTTVSLDPHDAGVEGVVALGTSSLGYGYAADFAPWLRAHRAEFDAVLVHGLWQYPGFGTWRALRGTCTPYFVFCHGMLDPWFKRTYPLKHLKKWLYWPWAEYRVLRDAAGVLFTCDEERRLARESFRLYRAREEVVPLGLPAPRADTTQQRKVFRALLPALGARPFLLFLGRIHPKKGLEELLRGYALAQRTGDALADLVVAGPCRDARYRATLDALATREGIDRRVHWLPMLEGEAKWGALRECEAFTLVSHQENFGLAVVESLACARPVLISNQVNLWREITTDAAGFAAPDTVDGAVALLRRWAACPAAQREQMSVNASRCYAERYSISASTDRLTAVIDAALAGSTPPDSSANLAAPA